MSQHYLTNKSVLQQVGDKCFHMQYRCTENVLY